MTENIAAKLVATYFESWRSRDFDTLRSILADDANFVGPLGTAETGDACRQGLEGLSKITTDIVIRKMVTDGNDVITWFELHTTQAPPMAVANWSHIENGKIKRIRVTFDPRPLTGGKK
ncbi:nuclear transport factor 2 family protein [Pendulispora brunnea]|uniref:Nuclear transport factor 2 family protein n=1 Tax=Pendulispora brunnea TaxID=2905690 RepID=A0ABZ2KA30_9BACT